MHRSRHLLATALAGLLAGTACAAAAAEGQPLKVGVYELPGIVSLEGGRPVGIAIDFWREIADRLGLEATFVVEKDIATLMAARRCGESADQGERKKCDEAAMWVRVKRRSAEGKR